MKVVEIFMIAVSATALVCVGAAPAKLGDLPSDPFGAFLAAKSQQNAVGYVYEPPAQPSGLYELPGDDTNVYEISTPPPPPPTPSTTTTTTTTTPPPPPSGLYGPPDEIPLPNEPNVDIIIPNAGTTTMMPMPYNIAWNVRDDESGNMFNHIENSDGKDVSGEYSVLLPDGRMQVVRFRADPINGYQAEVTYEIFK